MNLEHSCGAVLYRIRDGEPYYTLVKGSGGFGFPKGHMEGSESETDTALREIREERGVHPILDTTFRRSVEYQVVKKKDTYKVVTFFLAACPEREIPAPMHEISEIREVPVNEAEKLLWLDGLKTILVEADSAIRERIKNKE